MHQLNDQWVEVIDGKEHMVKAVMPSHLKINLKASCHHCFYVAPSPMCACRYNGKDCPVDNENSLIVKDLGILCEGFLPCPFCGEYPKMIVPEDGLSGYACYCANDNTHTGTACNTEQQAIDAWNRRAM